MRRSLELPQGVLATVSRVQTSPDAKTARVFIVITPHTESDATMRLLRSHAAGLQRELNKELSMKFSPKIHFELDQGAVVAGRVEQALDDIQMNNA